MKAFLEKYGIAIFILIIIGIMVLLANGIGNNLKNKETEEINKSVNNETIKKNLTNYSSLNLPKSDNENGYGNNIWTDGENIYYSNFTYNNLTEKYKFTHYKLQDRKWVEEVWDFPSDLDKFFIGQFVWTDGVNTYYSLYNAHYILEGNTWKEKTWQGLTYFSGNQIWTDGTNTYCSFGEEGQYILKDNQWIKKEWNGFNGIGGSGIWSDGVNIYYSDKNYETDEFEHYKLNEDTWEPKRWNGLTEFSGINVWSDGTNIYYSHEKQQYVLNGNTWVSHKWNGRNPDYGYFIWTDGNKWYYTEKGITYMIN